MPPKNIISPPRLTLWALCLGPLVASAQTSAVQPSPPPDDEVVTLSVFEVSSEQASRYQADQMATGGRIATDIMDTPATVTVLTRDFIQDVGSLRVLDAAKYVAGIGEATIPNALDRVNIRGFQSDGRRVDGFSTADQANFDTVGIERMEIIKGPDAVLQPAGVPGGTINLVTKSPKFHQGGYLSVQAGQYDSNRVEADVTGPLSDSLAYRVVTAVHDSEGYVDRSFRESIYAAPSVSWRMSPSSLLTVRYEYYDFDSHVGEGVPVDPSVGTNDEFKLLAGVPRDFSPALEAGDREYRRVTSHSGTFLFNSTIGDRLSVRVAGRIAEIDTPDRGFGWGVIGNGGSRDPQTGLWVAGSNFLSTAPYTASPATPQSRTFNHTGTDQGQRLRYRDLQNDWAYSFDTNYLGSVTSAGFAYAYESQNLQARSMTAQPFQVDNFSLDTAPVTFGAYNTDRRRQISRLQAYINQKVELFDDRLILTVGATNVTFNGVYGNKLSAATPTAVAGQMYAGEGSANTVSYGAVVKPIENLSIYYGHSENAVPQTNFQQVTEGRAPRISEGTQDEFGVKVQLLDKRLLMSVSYYEIDQTGYSLANPANLTSPPPPVLLPALILTRIAKGWEYQITAGLTKNLTLIASYADTKNRDPNGIPFRSSAEELGAIFLRYAFKDGTLDGLAIGVGANYMGKRAGDVGSGYTSASTPDNLIPNQPSFYLPAQTLMDMNVTYARGDWEYRLAVANLLDEENYPASGARNTVVVGNPRNISGSVTWKF